MRRRRRTRDRTADPVARPPAGARAALGAPRRAASDQEARAADGAARERRCRPRSRRSSSARPAATSIRRIPARSAPTRARDPAVIVVVADVARPLGAGARRRRSTRAITCSAARCRRSTASARTTSTSLRWSSRAHASGGQGGHPRAERHRRWPDHRALHHRPACAAADVKVTRLAHGVPVGGELDYLDDGTLSAAIRQRTAF